MLARFLAHFLFNLLHLVLSVYGAFKNVYQRIFVDKVTYRKESVDKQDVKLILETTAQLKKKLHHLVMMSNSHQNFEDLALVIIWSLIAGVPYISLYDITGGILEHQEKLFLEVEKRKKGIPGCIKWSNMPDLNGFSNGSRPHTISVNIFTKKDGKSSIVECIKRIAREDIPIDYKSDVFDASKFDNCMSLLFSHIPEPDLVLYTGPFCSTHGLLPWHIRLTEFVQLSSDKSVSLNKFLGALCKYNKCDQRFGK